MKNKLKAYIGFFAAALILAVAAAYAPPASAQDLPSLPGMPELPASTSQSNNNQDGNNSEGGLSLDNSESAIMGAMENSQNTQQDIEAQIRRDAFDSALQSLLPLRPNEIRELLEHFDRTQESVEVPVYPAPKPEVAVKNIALDPGTKPAVIKVSYGHVTTATFLDSTGAPWPIEDISWAGNFEIINSGGQDSGQHILRITPQSEFAFGNMSIRLLGLQTPVIMTLETSRDIVHYRFDAILPGTGPNASTPLIDNAQGITAGTQEISSILEGLVPGEADRLTVSGVDSRTSAYKYNGVTYVRTPLTLLSPSWSQSVSSADGMRVYAIQDSPVVLLSENGKMRRARLSQRKDLFDE